MPSWVTLRWSCKAVFWLSDCPDICATRCSDLCTDRVISSTLISTSSALTDLSNCSWSSSSAWSSLYPSSWSLYWLELLMSLSSLQCFLALSSNSFTLDSLLIPWCCLMCGGSRFTTATQPSIGHFRWWWWSSAFFFFFSFLSLWTHMVYITHSCKWPVLIPTSTTHVSVLSGEVKNKLWTCIS